MSECYLGEIRLFAGNYAPEGWALCSGQLLPIVDNEPLFSLLGTTFGGDGQSTFALPDLRGRLPVHPNGSTIGRGSVGGQETVALTISQLPAHTHIPNAAAATGTVGSPAGAIWAANGNDYYSDGSTGNEETMHPNAVGNTGGSQPHDNMMPSLTISFIISLDGAFPPQP